MAPLKTFVSLAVVAVLLSACGDMRINSASHMKASGSAFEKALHAGYLKVAKTEQAESDFITTVFSPIGRSRQPPAMQPRPKRSMHANSRKTPLASCRPPATG
jgi:hypothetical protein